MVNEDYPVYGIEGGNDTLDKVHLLSIGEVINPTYGFCDDYSTYSVSRCVQESDYAGGTSAYWRLCLSGDDTDDVVTVIRPGRYAIYANTKMLVESCRFLSNDSD